MLLLIFFKIFLHERGLLPRESEAGVTFWGALYIPVVVAMAANQNVVAAVKGGPVAVLSALAAVIACACVIAALSRSGEDDTAFEADADSAFADPSGH